MAQHKRGKKEDLPKLSAFDEDAASSNSSSHGVRHPPLGWLILRAAFIAEETDRPCFTVQGAHSNWVTIFRLIRSRNLHFGTVWFFVWFFSVETHGKNPPKKPLEMDGKQLTGHCFNKKKKSNPPRVTRVIEWSSVQLTRSMNEKMKLSAGTNN